MTVGFAFKSEEAAITAADGKLGDAIRQEIEAKGFRVVAKPTFEVGLNQLVNGVRPIANPADLAGIKLRTAPSRQVVDLFRTLGANPTPVPFPQTYASMQTHLVDGAVMPLTFIEFGHFYEVQRYLSMSNHGWGGFWMVANPDKWKALPEDVQRIVARLAPQYITMQRRDVALLSRTLLDKLARQGMQVNSTDPDPFRARLGAYYARCKGDFGAGLWSLLEESTGSKLA
jgi:TRAP-type C4-dicarboxylate transport system substrate-binding protein